MSMDMKVTLAGVSFKNPIITASGTFGFGREYSEFYDLSELGGVTVKGLTLEPRLGNPAPRIAETPMGMLNSVGLQNPGVEEYIRKEVPFLRQFDTKILVNISGKTVEEYAEMSKRLNSESADLIEVNISCPNVQAGGMAFGTSPDFAYQITQAVKSNTDLPVIVKLSPNVTDITEIAKAAEAGGADGLSLINTLLGMRINLNTGRPILKRNVGGLSRTGRFPGCNPNDLAGCKQCQHSDSGNGRCRFRRRCRRNDDGRSHSCGGRNTVLYGSSCTGSHPRRTFVFL